MLGEECLHHGPSIDDAPPHSFILDLALVLLLTGVDRQLLLVLLGHPGRLPALVLAFQSTLRMSGGPIHKCPYALDRSLNELIPLGVGDPLYDAPVLLQSLVHLLVADVVGAESLD